MAGRRVLLSLVLSCWATVVIADRTFSVRAADITSTEAFTGAMEVLSDGAWQRATGAAVTVAVGDKAFVAALQEKKHPPDQKRVVLGVAVTRSLAAVRVAPGCHCSAIWQGVPLRYQLRVLHAMLPAARDVGVLLGSGSAWEPPEPSIDGIELQAVWISDPRHLGQQLRSRLPSWDALLLPVDRTLFGAGDAKLILLTSYRQRVPVFGPGMGYVQAGSVASAYTSAEDMARATLDWLDAWRSQGTLPPPGFAGRYSLIVNEHVADAYDLLIQDRASLKRALGSAP